MKTLFFFFFPFIFFVAAAETTSTYFSIKEGLATYNQTVTFDFENQLQVIEVPAHNSVVHSKSFFYFNKVNSPILLFIVPLAGHSGWGQTRDWSLLHQTNPWDRTYNPDFFQHPSQQESRSEDQVFISWPG